MTIQKIRNPKSDIRNILTFVAMKGIWKLIFRFVKLFVIFFIGISLLWVLLYKFVNPPVTWLMVTRGFERKADGKDWKIDKEWKDFDAFLNPDVDIDEQ